MKILKTLKAIIAKVKTTAISEKHNCIEISIKKPDYRIALFPISRNQEEIKAGTAVKLNSKKEIVPAIKSKPYKARKSLSQKSKRCHNYYLSNLESEREKKKQYKRIQAARHNQLTNAQVVEYHLHSPILAKEVRKLHGEKDITVRQLLNLVKSKSIHLVLPESRFAWIKDIVRYYNLTYKVVMSYRHGNERKAVKSTLYFSNGRLTRAVKNK